MLCRLWLTDFAAHALEARLRATADEPHPTAPSRGEPYGLPVGLFCLAVLSLLPDDGVMSLWLRPTG